MKKKISKKDNLNLFFSAFLILAYIVCGYFFVNFAETQSSLVKVIIISLVFVIFGGILFYATRVGEGKPVKRFSIVALCLLDIPSLYIVLATIISVLPLHGFLLNNAIIFYMAAVVLGYGIPYTFLSGFELVVEAEAVECEEISDDVAEETQEVLEGGIEEEIQEVTADSEETETEEVEEIAVEGVEAEETAEADEEVKTEE